MSDQIYLKRKSTTIMPEVKISKMSIQPDESLNKMISLSPDEPSKVAHMENSFDPK
jgi:hypothetical protein